MIDYEIPSNSHHYPWYKSKDKINLVSFFNIEGFEMTSSDTNRRDKKWISFLFEINQKENIWKLLLSGITSEPELKLLLSGITSEPELKLLLSGMTSEPELKLLLSGITSEPELKLLMSGITSEPELASHECITIPFTCK